MAANEEAHVHWASGTEQGITLSATCASSGQMPLGDPQEPLHHQWCLDNPNALRVLVHCLGERAPQVRCAVDMIVDLETFLPLTSCLPHDFRVDGSGSAACLRCGDHKAPAVASSGAGLPQARTSKVLSSLCFTATSAKCAAHGAHMRFLAALAKVSRCCNHDRHYLPGQVVHIRAVLYRWGGVRTQGEL